MSTVRVPFLSDQYFELAGANPVLADTLALGERVIVVYAGTAYEVVAADESGDPITPPPPLETDPIDDRGPVAPPLIDPPVVDLPVVNPPAPVAVAPQPVGPTGTSTVPLVAGAAAVLAMAGLLIAGRRRA